MKQNLNGHQLYKYTNYLDDLIIAVLLCMSSKASKDAVRRHDSFRGQSFRCNVILNSTDFNKIGRNFLKCLNLRDLIERWSFKFNDKHKIINYYLCCLDITFHRIIN